MRAGKQDLELVFSFDISSHYVIIIIIIIIIIINIIIIYCTILTYNSIVGQYTFTQHGWDELKRNKDSSSQ